MSIPPPPPSASGTQIICQYCSRPMSSDTVNCPSCGKLRKDILNQKILCYATCGLGGLLIGISIMLFNKKREITYVDMLQGNTGAGGHTGAWVMLILGLAAAGFGIWTYIKVSQKLKTYIWT